MKRIPVVILSGFLGSGKTTFLLKLLTEVNKRGMNYSVLINERGKVDIDGLLVSQEFDEKKIESLLDGCICCSKKSEISQSIDSLLQKKPDIIFIELTGVANAEEVAFALNEKEIIAKVKLNSIITVVDAEFILSTHSEEYEGIISQQLECATHIVVNKMDLVRPSQKQEIQILMNELNTNANIEYAIQGELDFEILLSTIADSSINSERKFATKRAYQETEFSSMTTMGLQITRPIVQTRVEEFFSRHSESIVRAKGFVSLIEEGEEVPYLLQYSGVKRLDWKPGNTNDYNLVLIGIDLDSTLLREDWKKIVES